MRIVRFREYEQGWPSWGWVSEDRVGLIEGSPFSDFRREPASRPLSAVQLLAPVVPGKIICVARNYIAGGGSYLMPMLDLENVKINDTKVAYPLLASHMQFAQWKPWIINFKDVAADLTKVTSLAIGVDGAGAGTLYIDDIRVTRPAFIE